MDSCCTSRNNFTHNYSCANCGTLIMEREKVIISHYLTEFHHFTHELYPGKKNVDAKGRTAPGWAIRPYIALSKIPVQTNMFFCFPCAQNLFDLTSKDKCGACTLEIDESEDHTKGTLLKKNINGFNSHTFIKYHHDCLPSIFSPVKEYALNRRRKINGGGKRKA